MKKINQCIGILLILMWFSLNSQAKNITVTTAGTLSEQLSAAETQTIKELTLSGPLNGTDIALIRTTAGNLERLDLTNVTIVEGGNPYYVNSEQSYSTQNDIVGSFMFYSMVNLIEIKLPKAAIGMGTPENEYNMDSGRSSMENCTSLEAVELPTSLLWIGASSFNKCSRLKEIKIPEGVKIIGDDAFTDCKALKKLSLPSTLIKEFQFNGSTMQAGYACFSKCENLTEIILPEGLTLLYSGMFSYCTSLVNVSLPSTLKEIDGAFADCSSLVALNLPAGLTNLGSCRNCSSLISLDIPNGVTELGGFSGCSKLVSITLPTSITAIGYFMFNDCISLKSITIPDNVISIDKKAFGSCTSLSTVVLSASSKLKTVNEQAFRSSAITEINLPESTNLLGSSAFSGCKQLKRVTLPQNNPSFKMMDWVFDGCTALEEINLPIHLTSIPKSAFQYCSSLKEIKLPGGLIEMGYHAFNGCKSLTKIVLPGTLTSFEEGAFSDSGITEVTLNNGIRELPANTFSGCPLTTITFPKSIVSISGLSGSDITTVNFAAGAEPIEIGEEAFSRCTKLSSFTIPSSVKSIRSGAFEYSNLQSIILPETVTTLGDNIFLGCRELANVVLPKNITEITRSMFQNCKLKTIELPNKLEKIGAFAFSNSPLATIKLPESLKIIGNQSFARCTQLREIILPSNLEIIEALAFSESAISNIEIPASVTAVGEGAFNCRTETYSGLNTVVWKPDFEIPSNVFSQITYLYLPENATVPNLNIAEYIFRGGITDRIEIKVKGGQFVIAKEIKAKQVTFMKTFNEQSGYNTAAGWKTIVLPFHVDKFTYVGSYESDSKNITLAPFGSQILETDDSALPFWLYELTATGYKPVTQLDANKPYLICMPNNPAYPAINNISGYVRFSAQNEMGVTLVPTEGVLRPAEGAEFNLVPTYETISPSEKVYTLNEKEVYIDNPAGSVFVRNYHKGVEPFQAYLQTKEAPNRAPMFYSIGGGGGNITGLSDMILTPDKAVKVRSANGVIYLESNAERIIHIYDISGRTVYTLEAQKGVNEVKHLSDGIYFLEGQKVMVQK